MCERGREGVKERGSEGGREERRREGLILRRLSSCQWNYDIF